MSVPEYLDKRKVSQAFDRAAPHYEQMAHLQKTVRQNLLERIDLLKINPTIILDVGAGTGHLGRTLVKRYKNSHVYLLDIALQMMKYARKQAIIWYLPFWSHPQQHFVCSDAAQLPFPNDSVDLIVSNLMLQWCNDINVVFNEFYRVLKPDGALLFSTLGPDTLKELRHSWAQVDSLSHVNRFIDMHDIGDALLHAGLSNPVMDVDWLQSNYVDVRQLMQELKAIGAHNVTDGRLRGLMGKHKLQAMFSAYEQFRQTNGLLPATYEVVYGHAFGKQKRQLVRGVVTIPITQIGRRQK